MTELASASSTKELETKEGSSRSLLVLTALSLLATIGLYSDVCVWLVKNWYGNQDYSHGFFIPLVSLYLIWSAYQQRGTATVSVPRRRDWIVAVGLISLGVLIRVFGIYSRVVTLEGLSLLPHLLGVLTLIFGVSAWRWALPGICYLAFMLPLPGPVAGSLSGLLQSVATQVSTYIIQILGVPAVASGNIIILSNGEVGVAEACSGIRMLYSFFALTVGACMLIDRTPIEKFLIGLSAIPIAVAANCIRITATALAYEYMSAKFAEKFFHDIAGWLMMPIGFGLLFAVLFLLERLILKEPDSTPMGSPRRARK
ncbi:MAG: exosortase/archaeosortase family protein [Pirellula sp.]|jgi:exosortase